MTIKFVYKILPVFVFYNDKFVNNGFFGTAYGMLVAIREDQKNNESLLQHELVHCRQFYRTLGLHGLLYSISDRYKLKTEIEAYKVTIEYKGYTSQYQSEWIVNTLLSNYNLQATREEIENLLYKGDVK